METTAKGLSIVILQHANLPKHGLSHVVVWLVCYLAFIFFTTQAFFSSPLLHEILIFISSIALGVVTTTILHEWFHLFGAFTGRAVYKIPRRLGTFIFDWDFDKNSVTQFYIMSILGSVGGLLAILLIANLLTPSDLGYRLAVTSAFSSFIFGSAIEWPVLYRTIKSGDPYAELAKITPRVLIISLMIAILAGISIYLTTVF